MEQILLSAGIDSKIVLNIEEINNHCPWCKVSCGTLGVLFPCEHSFCESCMYSIIDAELFNCPVCSLKYTDFCMNALSLDEQVNRMFL